MEEFSLYLRKGFDSWVCCEIVNTLGTNYTMHIAGNFYGVQFLGGVILRCIACEHRSTTYINEGFYFVDSD